MGKLLEIVKLSLFTNFGSHPCSQKLIQTKDSFTSTSYGHNNTRVQGERKILVEFTPRHVFNVFTVNITYCELYRRQYTGV